MVVDNNSPSSVLNSAGILPRPTVLSAKLIFKKVATPFLKDVNTKPVEKGEFERSYAKTLRNVIESVSYVRLDETRLILQR